METKRVGENEALIVAMKELHNPHVVISDGDEQPLVLAVPNGMQIVSLKKQIDEYREKPERKKGKAVLTTLETFIKYVNRHRQASSAVFCDDTNRSAPRVEAIFDAHEPNVRRLEGDELSLTVTHGEPDWQDFRALYTLPMSDEWKAWTKASGKDTAKGMLEMDQLTFAAFLEDRIADVLTPSDAGDVAKDYAEAISTNLATPVQLMELARGLAIHSESKAQQSIHPTTGELSVIFTVEHKDGQGAPLRVPGAFAIGIPVFRDGKRYTMPVRLRFRIDRNDNNKVYWSVSLQRVDPVLDHALADVVQLIAKETELPVFRGTPS